MKSFQSIFHRNKSHLFALVFTVVFFALAVCKSALAPITHDESTSIQIWAPENIVNIWSMNSVVGFNPEANNHILNSIFIGFSEEIFGFNEFSHRLPNVLSFLMYVFGIYFSLKIFSKSNRDVGFLFPLSFVFAGFFDFFSLARGYGLSFGFISLSLWASFSFLFDGKKLRHLMLSQAFSILAILSNFTLLNFYLANFGILFLVVVFGKSGVRKELVTLTLSFVLAFLLLFKPISILRDSGAFYFGSEKNFVGSTVTSLFLELSSRHKNVLFLTLSLVFLFSLISYAIDLYRRIKTNSGLNYQEGDYVFSLIAIVMLAFVVQHNILGTPYLIRRATLFLWPLVFFLIFIQVAKIEWLIFRKLLLVALFSISLVFFVKNYSFTKTLEWEYDINSPDVFNAINSYCNKSRKVQNVSVGSSWVYVPSVNYYKVKNSDSCLEFSQRYEVLPNADFYFLSADDRIAMTARSDRYELINVYPDNSALFGLKELVK